MVGKVGIKDAQRALDRALAVAASGDLQAAARSAAADLQKIGASPEGVDQFRFDLSILQEAQTPEQLEELFLGFTSISEAFGQSRYLSAPLRPQVSAARPLNSESRVEQPSTKALFGSAVREQREVPDRREKMPAIVDGSNRTEDGAGPRGHELAAGSIGGDKFIVVNDNDFTNNRFYIVKPGVTETQDEFIKVEGMPDDLAQANYALHAVKLSNSELFFYGVHGPDTAKDGEDGTVMAYLYNHGTRKFEAVTNPPVALVDAQVAAIDEDRVMITGGRLLYVESEEFNGQEKLRWSVSLNPEDNFYLPVEQQIWIYDRKTMSWSELADVSQAAYDAQRPQSPRVGVATYQLGDEIWFIGGEEMVTRPNGTQATRPSTKVDIFDTQTLSWKKGPELPIAVAYAKVVDDGRNGIQLIGGSQRIQVRSRSVLEPMEFGYRITPGAETPLWERSSPDYSLWLTGSRAAGGP